MTAKPHPSKKIYCLRVIQHYWRSFLYILFYPDFSRGFNNKKQSDQNQ